MGQQNNTGTITENWVKEEILKLGLNIIKPVPDKGIDFFVTSPNIPNIELKIQVKGRGKIQSNKRYRWFQIRSTKKQREEVISQGLPVNEAWRIKASKVDIFIFVSELYKEFWIFKSIDIENLIQAYRLLGRKRKDNLDGIQSEIDLDILNNGIPLNEVYCKNLNNWDLIVKHFSG